MPKNIPGIVKRNRRRPVEKVRILVQPSPYPIEQPGMQPNVPNPMNAPVPPDYPQPTPQQMQPGVPNGVPQQMQPGSPIPGVPAPGPISGPIVPMQSSGQWQGDPNAQIAPPFSSGGQVSNPAWPGQAGPGAAPHGMPPQQGAYNNQPWTANAPQQPVTPPQVQQVQRAATPAPYNNNMPAQQGRHTPPPASNVSSQPLSQPGFTPAPQYSPVPPQYNSVQPSQPGLTPPANMGPAAIAATPAPAAPRTPSNSGLLGRSGPASLPGIGGPPSSAPVALVFIEIDGKTMQEIRLDKPVLTVGRQDGRDVQIKHQSVSRTHARIVAENGTWNVEDAGSVNGIVFNGQRVKRTAVRNGDRVFVAPNIALIFKFV